MALFDWSVPVASLVNKLQENGYKIFSVDDVIIDQNLSDTTARKKAVDEIVSVNDSAVALIKDKKTFAVYIVLGNDPDEIAADYTDNEDLERVIDSYNDQWEGKKCPTIKE